MKMADVTKINNEPIEVIFNSVNLGLIAPGDARVSFNTEWVMQTSHQTGVAPIEAYFRGSAPTIEVAFQEVDNWDLWITAFPTADKQVDTSNTRVAGNNNAANTPFIGTKATSVAAELVLRPIRAGDMSSEYAYDLTFPKAFCSNVDTIDFSSENPNLLPLTFVALFDPSASNGENLWFRGLKTGTWT